MDSRKVPALLVVIGVVLAIVLFLVLKDDTADEDATLANESAIESESGPADEEGGDDSPKQKQRQDRPEMPTIEIEGGRPVGGPKDLKFDVGETVRFKVRADAAHELHLHVYDLTFNLSPGEAQTIKFDADLDGLFELESHTTGAAIAKISIVPS